MGIFDRFRRAPKVDAAPTTLVHVTHMDAFENSYMGLGTTRDKTTYGTYVRDDIITDESLSSIYYGNDLAATVVDAIVDEAFRKGFCVEAEEDKETGEELFKWANENLKLHTELVQAIKFGRLFGGALLILGLEDGQDLDQPLNEDRIKDCKWTLLVDRRFATPASWYTKLGPKLGKPETYRISMSGTFSGGAMTKPNGEPIPTSIVHETRCIRFEGQAVDRKKAMELYSGWTLSVLQRPYPILRGFEQAMSGVDNMLADASQGVFKLKNLIQMLASKNRDAIHQRLTMLDMGRSTARAMVLDETESFEKIATNFSGVADIIDRKISRLSACVKIPIAILMGQSAAGMNATGELDRGSWYDQVAQYQNTLTENLERLYRLLSKCSSAPTSGKELEICIEWQPLKELTEKDRAELRKLTAEADQLEINSQVADPAQIAIARYGKGHYDFDAAIEVDVSALEAELEQRATFEPPTPPPGAPPILPDPNAPPGQSPAVTSGTPDPADGTDGQHPPENAPEGQGEGEDPEDKKASEEGKV